MPVTRLVTILFLSLLSHACQDETLTGIQGRITSIHYVTWEQANNKPDAAFIRLDNGKEYRFVIKDRLPLKIGQQVIIQPATQPGLLKRQILPACAITPLNHKGKALRPLALAPSAHCG